MTSSSEVTNELYAGLSTELRQELASHGQAVTVPPGTKLLLCGTCPGQLIILNSGSAEISVLVAGKPLSLGVARTGKVFGLRSIIAGAPPDTNVTCLEQCDVTLVPQRAFLDILQRQPQMYVAVAKVLSSDLAAADSVIRNHARSSAARAQTKCIKPE